MNKIDMYDNILKNLYLDYINFSTSNSNWINQDLVFCDEKNIYDNFCAKYDINKQSNIKTTNLAIIAGIIKGRDKIINNIKEANKKCNIINYKTYYIFDYDKISNPDNLSGAAYISEHNLRDIILVAVKKDEINSNKILDVYDELNYLVINCEDSSDNTLSEAFKKIEKAKKPVLIVVNPKAFKKKSNKKDISNIIKTRVNANYKKWLNEYDNIINRKENTIIDVINNLSKENETTIDLENTNFKLDNSYTNTMIKSSEKILNIIKKNTKFFNIVKENNDRLSLNIGIGLSISKSLVNIVINDIDNVCDLINLSIEENISINVLVHNTKNIKYIENSLTFYPCDIYEIIGSFSTYLKYKKTSIMYLSDKESSLVANTNIKYVKYGAYMIKKEESNLDLIILSSGVNVSVALKVDNILRNENINARIVSMPSINLFLKQPKYEKELLNKKKKTFVLDNNSNMYNYRFATNENCVLNASLEENKIVELIKNEIIV